MSRTRLYAALVLALFLGSVLIAGAQYRPQDRGAYPEMMAQMHEMQAMDKKLDELVAKMNQAKGDRKLEAMANVVNEMVTQRKEMRAAMREMRNSMMSFMMERMQDRAGACPMMPKPEDAPKH